ncbi:putative capsid protein [Shewanella phage SFCi1]|nr:putative capsid protein [Shewanella phage SFCi1]
MESVILDATGEPFNVVASNFGYESEQYYYNDGEKYAGGLGPVPIVITDYWALRQRSAAFFKTNPYGRGIIRRLVTNVINTGLSLEADPIVGLLGMDEDQASEWAIDVEDRFQAWASLPHVCDWSRTSTFGEIERDAYREALVEGDVLIIEHHNTKTKLPSYEMVSGSLVTSPLGALELKLPDGHVIEYGVELNARREQVAYYVIQEDFKHKRIPATGRNGRKLAWLYYATDKRRDDVRGEPLLSLVMQSVSEIDKYRDNTQRKATINAIMAMFFYQSPDSKAPNSRPISAGANRRVQGNYPVGDGTDYKLNMAEMAPGLVYDFLPPGVEPKAFTSDGTDEKFGDFEDAILSAIAWPLEMPKSVLKMEFSNSYSASRGEIKEFNMYLNQARDRYADTFTRIAYRSWLVAMTLTRRVTAPGLLEAWRDPMQFETFGAWTNSNWYGAVKEAVDLVKEVTGYEMMAENGYTTNNVASRSLTGTRFTTNIKRVTRENELKAKAMTPMLELQKLYGAEAVNAIMQASGQLRLVANSGEQIDG